MDKLFTHPFVETLQVVANLCHSENKHNAIIAVGFLMQNLHAITNRGS